MDIAVFTPAELPTVLGTLRVIDPLLTQAQVRFLEVIAKLHGASIDIDALPSPTLEDTAAIIVDPHKRKRLLQLAVVMTTIDGDVVQAPAANVAKLADALGVDERAVHTLRELAANHRLMARLDMTRRIVGKMVGETWDERWAGVRDIVGTMMGAGENADVAAPYRELEHLPPGSLGRTFFEHNRSRKFAFPGERGGIPERAVFHDLGHVLAGYDTDPEGEIQQAAFQAGFVRNDGFSFLLFAIIQFHLGVKITPIAEPEVGYFDVDKVMAALARGAACKIDLSDDWDFWPLMPLPLDDVRTRLGIPPAIRRPYGR